MPCADPKGFVRGPPDLAIEVVSSEDRPPELRQKVDEYLARGCFLVLVVDPADASATAFHPGHPPSPIRDARTLWH